MPRLLRLILPGTAVHIIQRGNNRAACFRQDADYLVYLSHLWELTEKYACALHAYCLMTNHVHLLMTPEMADGCAGLMRDLGQRYVQYFNRRYERSGTLWEGRFRSCIVESARYVLACYRYVEMNPVRAGMVSQPGTYPWSSHGANTGMRPDPGISPHPEFLALAINERQRRTAYRALFEREVDAVFLQLFRDGTNTGLPVASAAFKGRVLEPMGWKLTPGKPGPRTKKDSEPGADLRQGEFGL